MDNIFEQAARKRLRFSFKGQVFTAEDLFELPLTSNVGRPNLDQMAIEFKKAAKQDEPVSFVNPNAKAENTIATLQFEVVKRVLDIKMEEAQAAKKRREAVEKKQRILELMEEKQDESLKSKSLEELQKLLAEVDE